MRNVKSKPYIIGLTGGIATGKTTAAKIFKANGFIVIDSDEIVKELYQNNFKMLKQIEKVFNLDSQDLNFKNTLSKLIFNDEILRLKLNKIVHPYVYKSIKEKIKENKNSKYIVIDIPLLIEVKYKVDHIVLIYASKETQIKRLMTRDNITKLEAAKKIASQMDIEEKKKYANTIINNENDLKEELLSFIGRLKNEK